MDGLFKAHHYLWDCLLVFLQDVEKMQIVEIDIGHKDTLYIILLWVPLSAITLGITTGLRYDPKKDKGTGLKIEYLTSLRKLDLSRSS